MYPAVDHDLVHFLKGSQLLGAVRGAFDCIVQATNVFVFLNQSR